MSEGQNGYETNIDIGDELRQYIEDVALYKKRNCFLEINRFIYNSKYEEKVLILYGLNFYK